VLNADDERVRRMADHLPAGVGAITYGFSEAADVGASEIESLAAEGMRFRLRSELGAAEMAIPALGRHSVHNALAAAAAAMAAGLDLDAISAGLARRWSAPHRGQLIDLGPIRVLDDSYNAAPDSMIAALDLLVSLPGRHVAILGEMLELGDASATEHQRISDYARGMADLVLTVGPYAGAESRESVVSGIRERLQPGDVVLIKGSRGAAMDELLPVLEEAAAHMKAPVA
jgi:UDP-N-acetylmuramoyl-tripeptide--D-alanyl-D-alanine ligase